MKETIGQRIKRLRVQRGLRQWDVASTLALKGRNVVANWELGYNNPKTDIVADLAAALSVTAGYLLTGEDREAAWKWDLDKLTEEVISAYVTAPLVEKRQAVKATIVKSGWE